ncbi:LysR family transcriptional regulator [Parachitinimonas caeni]|uniref:LysR family transcriptional regulator n=1 Tax=Parachitinimonas caeni TaxID=3031301 RepID=A0ABT7DT13_9NEIS|nr:LysR family transcriptional regulator [Parachitinimonas caeni]MDK2123104.1 LysR family transcriptional regulator [Parachitinimonas caeni]
MDKLAAMRTLVRVIESGSFSAVAREQGVSQPTISKQIQWLEECLGGPLLTRSTRQLSPTQEGWRYYEECQAILHALDGAEQRFRAGHESLAGHIRLAGPGAFGRLEIVPHLVDFLQRYPAIEIDLALSDDVADLLREGIDVTFRCGSVRNDGLIARPLGSIPCSLFASARYLDRHGTPEQPADLSRHHCLLYQNDTVAEPFWQLQQGEQSFNVPVSGRLRCNTSDGLRSAVLADMGICYSQHWLFRPELASGIVRPILCGYQLAGMPLHAVYLPDRRGQVRVQALIDYLQSCWLASGVLQAPTVT